MSKKNNFRKTWRTLTELGQEFGVSAIKFGKILKEHGLREEYGEPTQLSKNGEFVHEIIPKGGKSYFLWHRKNTSEYLISKGVEKSKLTNQDPLIEGLKLARSYIEAQKLDQEGDKLGYLMFSEMVSEIKKIGLNEFNTALKVIGYKGKEITLEDWE